MSNVPFDENKSMSAYSESEALHSPMIGFLLKKGIAKTKSQANLMLIGVMALSVIIMCILFIGMRQDVQSMPLEELQKIDQRQFIDDTQ